MSNTSTAPARPLSGRRALVTGGGVGIGLACATALAERGAGLVILGQPSVDEAAEELRGRGFDVQTVHCDLLDLERTREVAREIATQDTIDILVNNAGIIHREPAVDFSDAGWRNVLDINLSSAWIVTQELGREMVKRGFGRIVSVASLLAFQGGINVVSYTASKHAIVGMTKTLANEWAQHGVTVNCVAPGYIATNNTAALRADEVREAEIRGRIPAGRWGLPEDIGGPVAFLAGPDAAYVNGHVLVIDGGWMAR